MTDYDGRKIGLIKPGSVTRGARGPGESTLAPRHSSRLPDARSLQASSAPARTLVLLDCV